MTQDTHTKTKDAKQERRLPVVSTKLANGSLVEMLYRAKERRTLLCVSKDGKVSYETSLVEGGNRLVPYSPSNNLLTNDVVLFPSEPKEYDSEEALVAEIRSFIYRYVDVSSLFEQIASYYVLLSWVYDQFSELPYLRLLGPPGSGKTRFLLTVGSLCYKPIFASGASTVSPLFRMLDSIRGTMILDEGDFRVSDEKAEIIKILNNGNGKGFPVLRTEVHGKEFNPRAYHVFGPKIIATRLQFQDRATESRCLTEVVGHRRLRQNIPINLPDRYKQEALQLRNKLLLFRFRTHGKREASEQLVDRTIEPRLSQVFVPLLSVIQDTKARDDLRELARRYNREMIAERGMDMEAQVLEVIRDMLGRNLPLTISEITSWFVDRHEENYDRKITPRWIGSIIRRKLHLKTYRGTGGWFEITPTEQPKITWLFERYGISQEKEPAGKPALGADE